VALLSRALPRQECPRVTVDESGPPPSAPQNRYARRIESQQEPALVGFYTVSGTPPSHLADSGLALTDYPTALERFFAYIVKTELEEQVSFTDFYKASAIPARSGAAVEVLDPVNTKNNVAVLYDETDRARIVAAAQQALNAVSEARFAPTNGRAVECWQVVLGPTFKG
jgi:hypothetical protein